MGLKRMDNVLIVVEDLEAVKAFFIELGLELEGETTVEGPMVGRLIGLKDVRATLAMLRPPDGHGGIELDKFHTPNAVRHGPVNAPVNTLGIRRVMFDVDDIDEVVARICAHGAELIGEMRYEDSYRLAYVRGPEGIIVGLAEATGKASPRTEKAAARPKPVSRAKPAGRKTVPRAKPVGRKKTARKGGAAGKKRKA
jgi:catechol 2,3-dioxygenase-like lactoylglutathione lyase family enzyme